MRNDEVKRILDNCRKLRENKKKVDLRTTHKKMLLAQVKAELEHSGYKII